MNFRLDHHNKIFIILQAFDPIKTEIIAEACFELDSPRYLEWCSVPCLSINDCFTAKLLANSDRYMDNS